jgi:hypothetical protein
MMAAAVQQQQLLHNQVAYHLVLLVKPYQGKACSKPRPYTPRKHQQCASRNVKPPVMRQQTRQTPSFDYPKVLQTYIYLILKQRQNQSLG